MKRSSMALSRSVRSQSRTDLMYRPSILPSFRIRASRGASGRAAELIADPNFQSAGNGSTPDAESAAEIWGISAILHWPYRFTRAGCFPRPANALTTYGCGRMAATTRMCRIWIPPSSVHHSRHPISPERGSSFFTRVDYPDLQLPGLLLEQVAAGVELADSLRLNQGIELLWRSPLGSSAYLHYSRYIPRP